MSFQAHSTNRKTTASMQQMAQALQPGCICSRRRQSSPCSPQRLSKLWLDLCPKISLTSKINLFGQASRKITSILFREIRCWQYDAVTCWKGIVIAMPSSHASPLVFAAKLPSVSQVFAFHHSASSDLSACTCGVLEVANAWPSLSKKERGFARVVQTW